MKLFKDLAITINLSKNETLKGLTITTSLTYECSREKLNFSFRFTSFLQSQYKLLSCE